MTKEETKLRIEDVFRDPMRIRAAIGRGFQDAARRYLQAGELMAGWDGEKVVWIDPRSCLDPQHHQNPVAD